MNKLPTSSLKEVCELIVDCPHFTPEWTDRGFIVIRNQNIRDGKLDLSSPSFTHKEDFERRIRRAKPRAGDIIFTREAPMGEVCLVPQGLECCVGQRQVLLRPGRNIDGKYLFFALRSEFVRHQIFWNEGTGSTVSNVRIPVLESLTIPRLGDAERGVGELLGALDDKIDLNRRMNETLEAMARAIFKDWFVDFGPTCAKAEGSAPYLAPEIWALFPDRLDDEDKPDGWGYGAIGDLANVSSGKRPFVRYDESSPIAQIPLWGGNGPMGFVPEAIIADPVVLTGRVGTLGSVFRITSPCWPSDNTLVLKTKEPSAFEYLYFQLKQIDFTALNRGSTQPLLTQTDLKAQQLVLPPIDLLERFHALAKSLNQRIDSSESESRTLAQTRDLLLPKLMSGEIRLREAEKLVEKVA